MPKAYVRTYGCQMNEQDSSQMKALLVSAGFESAWDEFDADLILINTCSIREKAVHKIYSDLGRIRPLKESKPEVVVGLAGCVSELEKGLLTKRFPFVDLVFGPDQIRHVAKLVAEVRERRGDKKKPVVQTGFDLRQDFRFINILPQQTESVVKAFVNIQKGCDNVCTFCIVPFVRGREVSRPADEIIDEIKALVERGVKEVTLLGQNVNSYGLKTPGMPSFAGLLALIAEKTDIQRVRFTSSHPRDVSDDLIDQFATNPIVCPQFHLPVQSGSDRILSAMRRFHTRSEYLDKVRKLQERAPEICFSSDIIVGFPGETSEDFDQTLSLMQEAPFDMVYSFAYSPRPHTKALAVEDDVPSVEKKSRLQELQNLERLLALRQNEKWIGSRMEVLIEEVSEEGRLFGMTRNGKNVHFSGSGIKVGDFVSVKITSASTRSLAGEV